VLKTKTNKEAASQAQSLHMKKSDTGSKQRQQFYFLGEKILKKKLKKRKKERKKERKNISVDESF